MERFDDAAAAARRGEEEEEELEEADDCGRGAAGWTLAGFGGTWCRKVAGPEGLKRKAGSTTFDSICKVVNFYRTWTSCLHR